MNQVNYKACMMSFEKKEIRRFTVNSVDSTCLMYLRHQLKIIFPQLKDEQFDIIWKDEDGDEVIIGSDEELAIALASLPETVKKIHVYPKQSSMKIPVVLNENDQQKEILKEVHDGVKCDGCESQIVGFRYKCLQCRDFDLCEKCESKRLHSNHIVMRLVQKVPYRNYSGFWKKMHILVKYFVGSLESNHQSEKDKSDHCKHWSKKCKSKHRRSCISDGSDSDGDGFDAKREKVSECGGSFAEMMNKCGMFVNPVPNQYENESAGAGAAAVANTVDFAIASIFKPFVDAVHNGFTPKTKSESENGGTRSENLTNGSKKDDEKTMEELSTKLAQQSVSQNVVTPSAPPSEPPVTMETEAERNGNLYPTIPTGKIPTDPKIEEALNAMLCMGFTNEGDTLRHILEEMDGDIMKVLDCIDSALK